ncbi:MAG: DUF928 domain-containing protein [Planktothrix sp.]
MNTNSQNGQKKAIRPKRIFSLFLLMIFMSQLLALQGVFTPKRLQALMAQAGDFKPPQDGMPSDRRAAGRRGPCQIPNLSTDDQEETPDIPLTALVPLAQETKAQISDEQISILDWELNSTVQKKTEVGITLTTTPQVWVYIPPIYNHIESGLFMIKDDQNNDMLEASKEIKLSEFSGIIGISIPSGVLEPGQLYSWHFEIVCDSVNPSKNPTVYAWIMYQNNPDLVQKIQQATSEAEKLSYYEYYHIWYDMLTFLAEKQQAQAQDGTDSNFSEAWSSLLENFDLSELKDKPVIP